ncbi:hypothetical protein P171DRAFT_106958 [Karstenula rhodostoma CBS 690.94]|uniref:Uncharacterized protein n=1 Tax=Karstenula rhodostoma CBS 690.94 TaxID=1392251 RepID=A0A9P4U912_9PLEO|nr:hypothetical protein P171DRAFT_106958 [Karstenula rhodostoma CBS 690.94]
MAGLSTAQPHDGDCGSGAPGCRPPVQCSAKPRVVCCFEKRSGDATRYVQQAVGEPWCGRVVGPPRPLGRPFGTHQQKHHTARYTVRVKPTVADQIAADLEDGIATTRKLARASRLPASLTHEFQRPVQPGQLGGKRLQQATKWAATAHPEQCPQLHAAGPVCRQPPTIWGYVAGQFPARSHKMRPARGAVRALAGSHCRLRVLALVDAQS